MICKCGKIYTINIESVAHDLDFYSYIEGRTPPVSYYKIYKCECGNKERIETNNLATNKQMIMLENLIYDNSSVGYMRSNLKTIKEFCDKYKINLYYDYRFPILTKVECDKAIKFMLKNKFKDKTPNEILVDIIESIK